MTRWRKIIIKEPTVPTNQKSFFEIEDSADARANDGMIAAYEHSSTDYKRAARERLTWLIQNCDEFSSDDIVNHLNKNGVVGNHSALGNILKSAKTAGLISFVRYGVSNRPERHKQSVKIWKSNLVRSE